MDLSSLRQLKTIARLLKKIYGESGPFKYHYLGTSSVEDSPLVIAGQAIPDALPLPLLLINCKPRISGYFDIRLMQDVTQAEMEIDPE
jgi:hypothetical protein